MSREERADDRLAEGSFAAFWESLISWDVPTWYVDGTFGIVIQWDPYAVAGFGSAWYSRNMSMQGSPARRGKRGMPCRSEFLSG